MVFLVRVRIFILLAVLAFAAGFIGACGGGDSEGQEVLESASLEKLESGKLDLSLAIRSEGEQDGDLELRVSGPFERTGAEVPNVDLTATVEGTANGQPIDLDTRATLLSDRGSLYYQGTKYELDLGSFEFMLASFLPRKPGKGGGKRPSALSACGDATGGFRLEDFAGDLADEGQVEVDGVSTTKLSGELDVGAALDAAIELAKDRSCAAQLKVAGISAKQLEEIRDGVVDAVQEAHVEVFVGADDIVRKISATAVAEPGDGERVEVELEFELTGVNQPVQVKPTPGGKSVLDWLARLGIGEREAPFIVGDPESLKYIIDLVSTDVQQP